jgi:hypothetical protein
VTVPLNQACSAGQNTFTLRPTRAAPDSSAPAAAAAAAGVPLLLPAPLLLPEAPGLPAAGVGVTAVLGRAPGGGLPAEAAAAVLLTVLAGLGVAEAAAAAAGVAAGVVAAAAAAAEEQFSLLPGAGEGPAWVRFQHLQHLQGGAQVCVAVLTEFAGISIRAQHPSTTARPC